VWTDPDSGYSGASCRRRALADATGGSGVPPGRRVAYDQSPHSADIHQQVWLLEGEIIVTAGEQQWHLQAGDCVAFREGQFIAYENPGAVPARYLVSLVTLPFAL
jgi:uncharacterized cupin superfamily protein